MILYTRILLHCQALCLLYAMASIRAYSKQTPEPWQSIYQGSIYFPGHGTHITSESVARQDETQRPAYPFNTSWLKGLLIITVVIILLSLIQPLSHRVEKDIHIL